MVPEHITLRWGFSTYGTYTYPAPGGFYIEVQNEIENRRTFEQWYDLKEITSYVKQRTEVKTENLFDFLDASASSEFIYQMVVDLTGYK